jgi:DNA-binding NarL/FixJ family response regulator
MTRVLIATNEPIMAKGLEAILMAAGLEIAAVCSDVFELFECLPRCRPDIAVLDLPVLSAQQVIPDLHRLAPRCRFLEWPRLTVSDSPAGLGDALSLMALFPAPDPAPFALVNLACSESERKLMALVGYGLNNEEIAVALGSDRPTVKRLVRNLSDRLGTEDRCELALYGLSTLDEADQDKRSV